jgi:glycosyltransferase involved in cell wall biosynthesis
MRTLLSVNNYFYRRGGAETVFLEHNSIFEGLGWQVVPFSMQHPRNLESPWSRYFVDELELGSDYSLAGKLARLPKVIYSMEARAKLRTLLAVASPDVCHIHNLYHHISPSILGVLRQRGIPTVMTLHDLKVACPAYSMLAHDGICERCRGGKLRNVVINRCIKGSLALSSVIWAEATVHRLLGSYTRHVDRFVVPSRFYMTKLAEWGLPVERFEHIPNFVSASAHEPRFQPGSHFVYVGRLSREKGVATLIRAASTAGVSLRIVGTGPQRGELEALAASLPGDIRFEGFLSGDALHEAIRSSRAFVVPSEGYENAPMTILEGYALGKPCIGAHVGGIPELVREGITGFCFPPGDAAALATRLNMLSGLSDAEVARLGEQSRAWVETEFSVARYVDRISAVYRSVGIR